MWDVEAHYGPSGHGSWCCICPSCGAWAAGRELFPLKNKCALPRVALMSFVPKPYTEWTLARTPIVDAHCCLLATYRSCESEWKISPSLNSPMNSYELLWPPKENYPTDRQNSEIFSLSSLSFFSLLPLLLVYGLHRFFYHQTSSLAPETFLTTFILPHFSCLNSIRESK